MLGNITNKDETYGQYFQIKFEMGLITSANILITAYTYSTNLFPVYNSFGENKTNRNAMKAILIGLLITTFVYQSLAILSIFLFGDNLNESVLTNVNEEKNIFSYIIRISFLIVLACHIPYIFFVLKESLLIIIDEVMNKNMT